MEPKRMTIDELEAILQRDDEVSIQILPNGEIRATDPKHGEDIGTFKPLTMREKLGGEYGGVSRSDGVEISRSDSCLECTRF